MTTIKSSDIQFADNRIQDNRYRKAQVVNKSPLQRQENQISDISSPHQHNFQQRSQRPLIGTRNRSVVKSNMQTSQNDATQQLKQTMIQCDDYNDSKQGIISSKKVQLQSKEIIGQLITINISNHCSTNQSQTAVIIHVKSSLSSKSSQSNAFSKIQHKWMKVKQLSFTRPPPNPNQSFQRLNQDSLYQPSLEPLPSFQSIQPQPAERRNRISQMGVLSPHQIVSSSNIDANVNQNIQISKPPQSFGSFLSVQQATIQQQNVDRSPENRNLNFNCKAAQIQTDLILIGDEISINQINFADVNSSVRYILQLQTENDRLKHQLQQTIINSESLKLEKEKIELEKEQYRQKYKRVKKSVITYEDRAKQYQQLYDQLKKQKNPIESRDRAYSPADSSVGQAVNIYLKDMTLKSGQYNPCEADSINESHKIDKSMSIKTRVNENSPNNQSQFQSMNEKNRQIRSKTMQGLKPLPQNYKNQLSIPDHNLKNMGVIGDSKKQLTQISSFLTMQYIILPQNYSDNQSKVHSQHENDKLINNDISLNNQNEKFFQRTNNKEGLIQVEIDKLSESSQRATSVHKQKSVQVLKSHNLEMPNMDRIDRQASNKGQFQKLLNSNTLSNLSRGQTISKQDTSNIRDRLMSESQGGSRGRFSSEDDQQVAYTLLIKIIQSMLNKECNTRELFQEKLYDYDTKTASTKGSEYILIDDFFIIITQKFFSIANDEKDRFKKVFAEIYQGQYTILDYNDLEQNLFCLESGTSYTYMQGKINLKMLDNKVYRVFNRMNKYIKEHYNGEYEDMINELNPKISQITRKMKVIRAIDQEIFMKFLREKGIRKSASIMINFEDLFKIRKRKPILINIDKLKNCLEMCKISKFVQLLNTKKRHPPKNHNLQAMYQLNGVIQEEGEDVKTNSFTSDRSLENQQ
ncbi:UNKNOWN [Stylonychia lemnae]|uniref:Uncharacterized protein n=1 Tax=Stylonychia lemnae TaxID=5949 RepID=A0A078AQU1_STYLE|nr:UNKNOWN [Stylonychia lemnae]|eukprot:CDW84795.1 UNKNOWN [Stylonychia lemnae]